MTTSFAARLCLCLALLSLTACKDSDPKPTKSALPSYNAKDPVGVFCGSDCSGCGFNVKKCLSLVKANLPSLCNPKTNNCYRAWMRYAKTCEYLCAHAHKSLAGEENLINITFVDKDLSL